jgi:hypothetical protein
VKRCRARTENAGRNFENKLLMNKTHKRAERLGSELHVIMTYGRSNESGETRPIPLNIPHGSRHTEEYIGVAVSSRTLRCSVRECRSLPINRRRFRFESRNRPNERRPKVFCTPGTPFERTSIARRIFLLVSVLGEGAIPKRDLVRRG